MLKETHQARGACCEEKGVFLGEWQSLGRGVFGALPSMILSPPAVRFRTWVSFGVLLRWGILLLCLRDMENKGANDHELTRLVTAVGP